jgi:AcrR family transcriptional regulator
MLRFMAATRARTRLEPEARRRQILEAARGLFATRGYASVSTAEIAREAGVTRGLVHHYFGGKREIYLEVVRTLSELASGAVKTDLGLPVAEMVAANADSWLDFLVAHPEMSTAVAGELAGDPEVAAVIDGVREAIITRIVVNHTGQSEAPAAVRFLLRSYIGLSEAACRDWLVHGRASREDVHMMLTKTLLLMMSDVLPALMAEPAR